MSNMADGKAMGRINALLDEGSFVEIGGEIKARGTDFNLKQTDTPGDGVITGYGVIDGNLVYVYSQDASVLGGAIGEMHGKKIANIYDMAMKMGAPVIGLIDSAGLRLQEGTDSLEAFGGLYFKQTMASGVIPQITAVFGGCGGGLSILTSLSDFVFMEEKSGKLFLNSPNAIEKNDKSKVDTSSAVFQSEESGLVDFVGNTDEILGNIRLLVTMLPMNNEEEAGFAEVTDDLNRLVESVEGAKEDTGIVLSMISDNGVLFESKRSYGKDMVTGFIKLNGMTIGAVANRWKVYDENAEVTAEFDGSLSIRGTKKAAQFVKFCDAFSIPVLTLTNVNGFSATMCGEKSLAKSTGALAYAFANATVPKVNVIIGEAFGSAYTVMNSKALGADVVYAWPSVKIGMMNSDLAAKIMYADEELSVIKEKAKEYDALQNSVVSAAGRGYVDTIIEPESTRKYLIGAFEMLYTKKEDRPMKKHGTV
ncbi:acetyl-CoA carboxylase carboxyltransferase component [Aequitasia blattaphilus]|uniref:Carboxyl transferase n=1 Tax=Aequitasia blattaphilus TaxID=2949332 RepID=A0ABT1E5K5_9FIRM|nr:carboxyl transferase domain-containing protein [Aequitasia blattaphilus]MCP1101134.1 carboxyl transferase [Aequitasia blattaphilus]MCR8613774.1 carboxyl transferase [Aequitasia blattaphilus]